MLKYENIFAGHGKKKTLSEISLCFPYGTITSILGPNGSGKSTMLHCLLNPMMISSGQITLDQKPLNQLKATERAKRISFLPQSQNTPSLTVKTLVSQGRYPYHGLFQQISPFDEFLITKALCDTGMTALSNEPLLNLSGGELKRAYLAMILAQNTDYIILDEPISNLDIKHRLEFLNLLCDLKDKGKTIVIVLHDISDAYMISDIMVFIKEGKIVRTMTKEEFLESNVIPQVFEVEFSYCLKEQLTLTSFHLTNSSQG